MWGSGEDEDPHSPQNENLSMANRSLHEHWSAGHLTLVPYPFSNNKNQSKDELSSDPPALRRAGRLRFQGHRKLLLSPLCLSFCVHLTPFLFLLHTQQDLECIAALIFFSMLLLCSFVNSCLVCFLFLLLCFQGVLPTTTFGCIFPLPYRLGVSFFSFLNSSARKSSLPVLLRLQVGVHTMVCLWNCHACVVRSCSLSFPFSSMPFLVRFSPSQMGPHPAHHVYSITSFPLILLRSLPLIS